MTVPQIKQTKWHGSFEDSLQLNFSLLLREVNASGLRILMTISKSCFLTSPTKFAICITIASGALILRCTASLWPLHLHASQHYITGTNFAAASPAKGPPLWSIFSITKGAFSHTNCQRVRTCTQSPMFHFFHRKKIKRASLFTDFISRNATLLCFTDTHYSIWAEVAGDERVYFYVVDVCTYADTRCICMISGASSFINLFCRSETRGWISTTARLWRRSFNEKERGNDSNFKADNKSFNQTYIVLLNVSYFQKLKQVLIAPSTQQ